MAGQRIRRIVVDEQTYVWRVRPAGEGFLSLRLWREGDRIPIADVRLRFDDPWLYVPETAFVRRTMPDRLHDLFALEPVRPHQVAELIRACLSHPRPGRDFELVDGELRPAARPAP